MGCEVEGVMRWKVKRSRAGSKFEFDRVFNNKSGGGLVSDWARCEGCVGWGGFLNQVVFVFGIGFMFIQKGSI